VPENFPLIEKLILLMHLRPPAEVPITTIWETSSCIFATLVVVMLVDFFWLVRAV
jgi:hypothetical protein